MELKDKKKGGLAGVIASDSSICLCGAEDESLLYRGYCIEDLANHATFEEVAYLLLRGHLPNRIELDAYKHHLMKLTSLSPTLKKLMEEIPPTYDLMAAIRSQISLLGHLEPEDLEEDKTLIPDRLIASISSMLLYWYYFHTSQKRIEIEKGNSIASHILTLIRQDTPSEEEIRALDVSLILYAEHEFNASTFTVRTIASTLADIYSAICGGVGALSGPLHGGANEKAYYLIAKYKTPDEAEAGILDKLKNKELIMGFGHRVYTTSDPRSEIIKKWAYTLSKNSSDAYLFPIAERIDHVMKREKGLFTNLDFYSALVYHYLKIPTHFFTPIFVMSRVSGWCAHLNEQRENNRIIRPLSNYIGPKHQKWMPIDARKT